MDYCKYHPIEAATYHCTDCSIYTCDSCINDGKNQRYEGGRCFTCGEELDCQGARNTAIPFWRRLPESFRYPLDSNAIILIIAISIVSAIVISLPFGFILAVAVEGAFIKYCFTCLNDTSDGNFNVPKIERAYKGAISIALMMIGLVICAFSIVFLIEKLINPAIANFVAVLMVISTPAVVIVYAITDDLKTAVNPISILRLMLNVGLSYGLLLGFILLMVGSVNVINQFIGENISFLSGVIQSMVTNYYLVVLFHMMGYMIFQYQAELGFSARVDSDVLREKRNDIDVLKSRIDVTIKEGDYEEVALIFEKAIKNFPKEKYFFEQYFQFLMAVDLKQKQSEWMKDFIPKYFDFLIKNNLQNKMPTSYKFVINKNKEYQFNSAELKLKVAKACFKKGEARLVAHILKDLHKQHPKFDGLSEAYLLMADALDTLPKMKQKADKYRQFSKVLNK
ncbi:MAG: hypothetical protein COA86_12985 [Kangiella sp.]|nr:MAG: hypothetical protein COA86_12985 [Kangiella sp.]